MGQGADDADAAFETKEAKAGLRKLMKENALDNVSTYMRERYEIADKAKVGEVINCPTCNKSIKKKSYQHKFCSNKGTKKRKACKDVYWNVTDHKRRARAQQWKN